MSDRIVVVTGAGSGIGAASAQALAEAGAVVAAIDRDLAAATTVAESLPTAGSVGLACDVGLPNEVTAAFAHVASRLGRIDVLVNNAGIVAKADGPVDQLDVAAWHQTLAVNLTGLMLCAREVLPLMLRDGGGSIVNIASVGGAIAGAGNAAYSATKAGVVGLTRSMALTHGSRGIRTNAICPGSVKTAMTAHMLTGDLLRRRVARIPLGRQADASELGAIVTFLASPLSSYMNGAVLTADGGLTINIEPQ